MSDPQSIFVILPGALGDVINTIPALKSLGARFPKAAIEAAGNRQWMELLLAGNVVDAIQDLELPGFHTLFSDEALPDDRLKNFLEKFDLIISWLRDRDGTMEDKLMRLGKRSIFFKEKFPPAPGSLPASMLLSQPVRELGIHELPKWPELNLSGLNTNQTHEPSVDSSESYVVIHPGSGSESKCWPADRFARIAETLTRDIDLRVIALEGPADEEAAGEMLKESKEKIRIVKDLPVLDVAFMMSRAKLFIGNDSGISHLAAALGIPSVVVFGPTDPGVWGPRQPWTRNIPPDVDCAPCREDERRTCEDRKCLDSVPAQEVLHAALELILESGI